MAGLVGAGRSEIAQACFGMTPPTGGQGLPRRRGGHAAHARPDAELRARLPAGGPRRPGPDHGRRASSTTSPCRSSPALAGSASSTPAPSGAWRARRSPPTRCKTTGVEQIVGAALGRQPPEGRLRQVAGHEAARADPRRADARHRRRARRRRSTDHRRARRLGAGDPGHLVGPAGGAGDQRPHPRHRRGRARGRARCRVPPTRRR